MIKTISLAAAVALMASTASADITIATAGPMTGQYASFGEQMKAGAEAAVRDINAAGGVLGQMLKLEVGDDACDPKQAVAVANRICAQTSRSYAQSRSPPPPSMTKRASSRSLRRPPIRS